MIYSRLIAAVLTVLLMAYYVMIVLHLFKVIKITNRDVTFGKALIPFYYWIVSQNKEKK